MLLNQASIKKPALLDQDNIMLSIKKDLKIKELQIFLTKILIYGSVYRSINRRGNATKSTSVIFLIMDSFASVKASH